MYICKYIKYSLLYFTDNKVRKCSDFDWAHKYFRGLETMHSESIFKKTVKKVHLIFQIYLFIRSACHF